MRKNRAEGKGRQKGKKEGMYGRRRSENDMEEGDEKGSSEERSGGEHKKGRRLEE